MIIVAFIGFFSTRYVLDILGVSDYGLYNVVGGVVTMLNFVSIGMMTTTRRYVNVEMGKKDGNLNKVFNVCFCLHFSFALFIYLIAITIGLWYINNLLNVSQEKLSDARFVYFISTTVSALGIINIPYQALMAAYERFRQIAIIDIASACFKIPLIVALILYTGNHLRFYAIGICIITLFSLIAYSTYCQYKFSEIVNWHFYRHTPLYKEILVFNNYTSLGAFAHLVRSQGSPMVINFFFGTIVNGAFAIAHQIESQVQTLVSNLSLAANPQMTQSYSAGNFERSFELVCKITRFSSLIMILLTFTLFVEIEALLGLWLKETPLGAVILSKTMLLSLLIRSLGTGVDGLIQATGKVKWYQISQSFLLAMGIPLSIVFFWKGLPPVYIIYSFIFCDILRMIVMFIIICNITPFDFRRYAFNTYIPLIKVLIVLSIYYLLYQFIPLNSLLLKLFGLAVTFLVTLFICMMLGMAESERSKTIGNFLTKIR